MPPSYRCNSSTLQVAGFVTSNGGGLANSPRAMSKIMPPMSNVKTRAIRKSRKNSFTGRGFYHTQLAVGKSLVLNDQSDRGGGAHGAHSQTRFAPMMSAGRQSSSSWRTV